MSKHIEIINRFKGEYDLKQRVINTIVEVEIWRVKNRNDNYKIDNQYRHEQARLMNILYNNFSRGKIDRMIREELYKILLLEGENIEELKEQSVEQIVINYILK